MQLVHDKTFQILNFKITGGASEISLKNFDIFLFKKAVACQKLAA